MALAGALALVLVLWAAAPARAEAHAVTIDASALDVAGVSVGGVGAWTPGDKPTFALSPGTYSLFVTGSRFLFSVDASGQIQYDSSLDGFVSGRDTSTLTIEGYDVQIDASALDVQWVSLNTVDQGWTPGATPTWTIVPGTFTIWVPGSGFRFDLHDDGSLGYASGLDGFLSLGSGRTLVIDGYEVTIDASALDVQWVSLNTVDQGWTPGATPTWTIVPGTFTIWVPGSGFRFDLHDDGSLGYASGLDGFLSLGSGRTLVIDGYEVTIDASALDVQWVSLNTVDQGWAPGATPTWTIVPGTFTIWVPGSGFQFDLYDDGSLGYASGLDGFLSLGSGRTLVIDGYEVTIDASALDVQWVSLNTVDQGWTPGATPTWTIVPGTFTIYVPGSWFQFDLHDDGSLGYASGLDGFLSLGSGRTLLVDGYDITFDASTTEFASLFVNTVWISWTPGAEPTYTVIPGTYYLYVTGANFAFEITLDGVIADNLPASFEGYPVSGAGTSTLVIGNTPPVADAGDDQEVECTSADGTTVYLDATGSYDPDDDAISYDWSFPNDADITCDDTTSATPTCTFPIGRFLVTLTVADERGSVACDDVLIDVVDTTAPTVLCTTDLIALWPPKKDMRPVTIQLVATDAGTDPEDLTVACTVSSSEVDDVDDSGTFVGDVDGYDGYTDPVSVTLTYDEDLEAFVATVYLRAERNVGNTARVYSIACTVTDASDNEETASCVVVVPRAPRGPKGQ